MATAVAPLPPPVVPAAPSSEIVLETHGLTKRFGAFVAVDNLDLTLLRGEVLGFLGPNGSGKSTTISMILGLVHPSSGRVSIMNQPLADHPGLVSRHIGAIIENPAFYPHLTGRDNLRAQAKMTGGIPDSRIDDLLKLVNMEERANRKFRTYSLGMKQRIGIASTLLTNPAVVILDEPTNGLDPAGQREIRSIIPRVAEEGHAVLLASHLLHEVEQVSHRVLIIARGRKVTEGPVKDLLRSNGLIDIRLPADDQMNAARILEALPEVERVSIEPERLVVTAPGDSSGYLNRSLARHGIYANEIAVRRSSLEELFLDLTDDLDADAPGTPSDHPAPSTLEP